jgi:ribosomal protein L23
MGVAYQVPSILELEVVKVNILNTNGIHRVVMKKFSKLAKKQHFTKTKGGILSTMPPFFHYFFALNGA